MFTLIMNIIFVSGPKIGFSIDLDLLSISYYDHVFQALGDLGIIAI